MKICIIGSGLTALVLAKSLAKKNIIVDLLCDNKEISKGSTRSIGISNKNLIFLSTLFPKIEELGNNINQIKVFNEKQSKEIINFQSNLRNQFTIFRYNEIYKFVLKNINIQKLIKKKKLYKNKNFYYEYNDNDLIIDTDLKSKSSKKFFFRKIKKNYLSNAYTTVIEHVKSTNSVANQIFTKIGPIAFLPLSNSLTSIVFSIEQKNKKLEKNDFYNLIKKYNNFYKINKFHGFETTKLELELLKNYYHKNVLAFGEKTHKIHPLAGQGFNMSLRDINCLLSFISKKIEIGLPLDSSLLHDFESAKKHKNFLFANSIDLIHEFFRYEKKLPKHISRGLFNYINQSKFLKKLSMRFANEGI